MNIVFIYPNIGSSGGVPKVQLLKASYLIDYYKYKVTIVCDKKWENEPIFFPVHQEIKFVYLEYSSPSYTKDLLLYLNSSKADIISCIALSEKDVKTVYKVKSKAKKIVEYRTSYRYMYGFTGIKQNFRNWFSEKLAFFLFIRMIKKYDAFTVLSEGDKVWFSKFLSNVISIGNPIEEINNFESPNYSSQKVIAVGRLEGVKNFSELIDIWKQVQVKFPNWELNIFGEGPLEEKLQNKIDEFGLSSVIHLCGKSEEIMQEMKKHSILVMTSRYEGFPNVLLEGAYLGLPIVLYDCGNGPKSIVINNKNGFVIQNRNQNSFVKQLKELINSKEMREEMGRNGQIVANEFILPKIMEKWHLLFSKLSKK